MVKIYKNKSELIKSLIKKTDAVLDVGFWGQGIGVDKNNWVHKIILGQAGETYGLDLDFDPSYLSKPENYLKGSAENFSFGKKFTVIFAGDLIEHLSNPGLFLKSCAENLGDGGRLVLTTPNCFNLFNMAEKLTKSDPTVNDDHICYFNKKTLTRLLEKNNWQVEGVSFLYSLEPDFKESRKKKTLNIIYRALAIFTPKFIETLVIVAKKNG